MAKRKNKFRPGGGRSRKSRQGASGGRSIKRAGVPVNQMKKQQEALNALRPVVEREKERRGGRAGKAVEGRDRVRGGGQAGK